MARLWIAAVGVKEAEAKFTNLSKRAMDMRPAMNMVADYMHRMMAEQWESAGTRGGTPWRPITAEWLARKIRLGGDPRIGFFRHELFDSYTIPDAPHQERVVTSKIASIKSNLPYAKTQQHHRPFIRVLPSDRLEMRRIVRDWLAEAVKK